MSNNDSNLNVKKNIKNVFDNMSYLEQYNTDIWITIVIIIITITLVIYFYIQNFIKSQKANWKNNKCNPLFMPFADALASDSDSMDSSGNYAEQNFNECLNELNYGISLDAKQPINAIFGILKTMFGFITSIISRIVAFFMYLLNLIFQLFTAIMERVKLLLYQVHIVLIRGNAFLQNIIYTLQDIYYTIALAVDLFKYYIVISLNAISNIFLVNGIVTFSSGITGLVLTAFLASVLTAIPFVGWALAVPVWASFVIRAILVMIFLVFLIFGILIKLKIVDFNNKFMKPD